MRDRHALEVAEGGGWEAASGGGAGGAAGDSADLGDDHRAYVCAVGAELSRFAVVDQSVVQRDAVGDADAFDGRVRDVVEEPRDPLLAVGAEAAQEEIHPQAVLVPRDRLERERQRRRPRLSDPLEPLERRHSISARTSGRRSPLAIDPVGPTHRRHPPSPSVARLPGPIDDRPDRQRLQGGATRAATTINPVGAIGTVPLGRRPAKIGRGRTLSAGCHPRTSGR